ncbi:MAG: very short patch repair endonuclease [Syntrophobacteraceae bacterium]
MPVIKYKKPDAATSFRMARVRHSGTAAELKVREVLRELGIHYRLQNSDLPGKPDLANRKRKWVIFVHGCFWHGHEGCPRASRPRTNTEYWDKKILDNAARDQRIRQQLEEGGWNVVTVWECEVKKRNVMVNKLKDLIPRSRTAFCE